MSPDRSILFTRAMMEKRARSGLGGEGAGVFEGDRPTDARPVGAGQ